jgi:hypothetical protein
VAITYTITERGSVMGCSPPLKSLSTLCGPAPPTVCRGHPKNRQNGSEGGEQEIQKLREAAKTASNP